MIRARLSPLLALGALLTAAGTPAAADENAPEVRQAPDTPACPAEASDFCRLPGAISLETARAQLADQDLAFWQEGSVLHVVARRENGPVRLCCALQETLQDLGDGQHWGMSFHIRDLDRAFLDIVVMPDDPDTMDGFTRDTLPIFRGPDAPPPPPRVGDPAGRIFRTDLPSQALGGARRLTVYVPPGEPPAGGWPVVYMADGKSVDGYGQIAEALADAGRIRPVVLVGIWDGNYTVSGPQPPGRDMRTREYLWGVDSDRFAAHEVFVLDTVLPWAEGSLNASSDPENRMLFGASNGAGWAVATALHNPGLVGHVSAASFLWADSVYAGAPDQTTRYSIGSGRFSGIERAAARHSTELSHWLQERGVEADFALFMTGHSPLGFEQQFVRGLLDAFPAEPVD